MTTITISGTPGSGKSTVAELLHEKTKIPYVYTGMIFRNLAKDYKMCLEEFGRYCESHEHIDHELDERQIEILKTGNVILEGRLSGWLAFNHNIDAVKIMIDADERIRAARIVNREEGTVGQQLEEMRRRQESERKRYQLYYGIDLLDTSIYDLVIDSTEKTPDEVVSLIISFLSKKDI
jgi:CMP/dCMP kinase